MTNAQVVRNVLAEGEPKAGDVIEMVDLDQSYHCLGVLFRRNASGRSSPLLKWSSECAVCGEPFETCTPPMFKAFTRTCKYHRGQPFRKKPKAKRVKVPKPRPAPLRDVVQGIYDALSLVDVVTDEALVQAALRVLPVPDGRDTRRQRIRRVLSEVRENAR